MNFNNTKYELQHILQGKTAVSYGEPIQAIASYLRASTKTSTMAERKEPNKAEETKKLINYINTHLLWKDLHDENVLTSNEILYFIDTVFFIKPEILWN